LTPETAATPPAAAASRRVLIVDDDQIIRVTLEDRLRMDGFETVVAGDFASARRLLATDCFDLVATDIRLPDGDGRDLFETVCRIHPGTPVILMTGFISVEDAVALTKAGAVDYLTKPFDLDEFVAKAHRAVERMSDLRAAPLEGPDGTRAPAGSGVLGRSPALRRIEEIAARIRDADSTLLVTGESGVGKEVVAEFIHRNSARASGPFVRVNLAALPAQLVAGDLFGVEKGAFPGADERRAGKFEQAQGGTLFLDEIAEVPAETQVMLLRVLQERRVEPLGGGRPVDLDVRVIAASQADLGAEVAAGRFRTDLFWRLNVLHFDVPPLRERPEDILFLARRFVAEHAARMHRQVVGLSAATEAHLLSFSFPGNVRQLRNMVERAVVLAAGPRIQDFELFEDEQSLQIDDAGDDQTLNLKANVESAERAAIERALSESSGVLHLAAEHLGVSRKTLWEKIRRYDIVRP
jgi:DNA-binding NtrC family response regulator